LDIVVEKIPKNPIRETAPIPDPPGSRPDSAMVGARFSPWGK